MAKRKGDGNRKRGSKAPARAEHGRFEPTGEGDPGAPRSEHREDEDDRDHRAFRARSRALDAEREDADRRAKGAQWDEERGPIPRDGDRDVRSSRH